MTRGEKTEERNQHRTMYEPPAIKKLGDLKEITRGEKFGFIDGLFFGQGGLQQPAPLS